MGRVILIMLACSVLMFAFAFQTQPQFIKELLSYHAESKGPSGFPATVQLSKPEKAAVRVAEKSSTRDAKVPVVPETPPVVAPPADASPRKSSPVVKVASESATLYAQNSSKAQVVGVLQKGEIVQPQLEMTEGGERWAFVEVASQNLSGFVQTQNLERK